MRKKSQKEELNDMMERPIPRKKIGIVHLEMEKEGRSLMEPAVFTMRKNLCRWFSHCMKRPIGRWYWWLP